MKPATILTLLAILTLPLLAGDQKGTVPRGAASSYAAHAEADGASIGAALLTPRDVHKAFSTDLTRCCRVVEVALYPGKNKPLDVSPDDFVLRLAGTDTAVKPSSARLLAAQLQKKNADSVGVNPVTEAHVGYESGIDPMTGQRVHGVDTGVGVGVGVGRGPGAGPASTIRDRDVMELELDEKSLPEQTAAAPVAGYLYFSLSKDNKKAAHQLEYTLNGQKVSLKLD
ncbi:MAG: hypothetical protein ABSF14_12755 [Terriglobia bacterium]|jgi:hypothetical protein